MYIRKILNYGKSWELLQEKYSIELNEIKTIINSITIESIKNFKLPSEYDNSSLQNNMGFKFTNCFKNAFTNLNWSETKDSIELEGKRRINLRLLGNISNNEISVCLIRHRDMFIRWLYSIAPIAYKNSLISIPIAVCLFEEIQEELTESKFVLNGSTFEHISAELLALSPLSNQTPFLIFGISLNDGDLDVIELESEAELAEQKVVINRAIEFPPEYHQAGLGILNYFGTVIREKYPEQNAKVKIEQDGLQVRMIIETEDGNKEIIEKALKEYELVLRGEKPIDEFFESKLQIMELKNELRIAHVRLESARDLLEHKNQEVETLKELFGHSLTKNPTNPIINVAVRPNIQTSNTLTNTTIINNDAVAIGQDLQELVYIDAVTPEVEMRLLDLSQSFENISNETDTEKVKNSSALKKLKSFIEEAQNTSETLNKIISSSSDGIDKLQSIGKKYNSIAEWCGAPMIPKIFLE